MRISDEYISSQDGDRIQWEFPEGQGASASAEIRESHNPGYCSPIGELIQSEPCRCSVPPGEQKLESFPLE